MKNEEDVADSEPTEAPTMDDLHYFYKSIWHLAEMALRDICDICADEELGKRVKSRYEEYHQQYQDISIEDA